jgi:hypothetical protein
MASESSLTSVVELKHDGSNWITWKFNIESVAAYKDWSIHLTNKAVEPTDPGPYTPPTTTTPGASVTSPNIAYELHRDAVSKYEKEKERYRQGKAGILRLILSSLPEAVRIQHSLTDDPHKVWDKLIAEYDQKNENLRTRFRSQMAKLVLQSGGNVREHAQKHTELRLRYQAMGGSMDDDVFISLFLDTLPEESRLALSDYMSILRKCGKTVTAEDVIRRAIERYDESNPESLISTSLDSGSNTAFATQNVTGHTRAKRDRRDITCFHCNKKGHYQSECYSNPDSKNYRKGYTTGNGSANTATMPYTPPHLPS